MEITVSVVAPMIIPCYHIIILDSGGQLIKWSRVCFKIQVWPKFLWMDTISYWAVLGSWRFFWNQINLWHLYSVPTIELASRNEFPSFYGQFQCKISTLKIGVSGVFATLVNSGPHAVKIFPGEIQKQWPKGHNV